MICRANRLRYLFPIVAFFVLSGLLLFGGQVSAQPPSADNLANAGRASDPGAKSSKPISADNSSVSNSDTQSSPLSPMSPNVCASTNYLVYSYGSLEGIDYGTPVPGANGDDVSANIPLPFNYTLYGQSFSSVNATTNGTLQFNSSNTAYSNICLPNSSFDYTILPFWDDLYTGDAANGQGIFTQTLGTAPNRVFFITWKATLCCSSGSPTYQFRVVLFENQSAFNVVYIDVPDHGTGATIGVQKDIGSLYTQYSCNTSSVGVGTKLIYVQPSCTACANSDYSIQRQLSGGTIVSGTTDIGLHTDDGVANVSLPFNYALYGQTFSSVNASSNGNLQFSSSDATYTNVCLPFATFNYAILPYWDDLRTDGAGEGVFTSISGSAPNRIFNVEWRAEHYDGSGSANFEVRLFEGTTYFEIVYGNLSGNTGTSATVGVQSDTGSRYTQFECNTFSSVASGMRLMFNLNCPLAPTPTPSPTATPVIVGHVTWQGRPAQPNALQHLPMTFTLKSGTTEVNYPGQLTDNYGFFTVAVGTLPSGTYNARVKGPTGGPGGNSVAGFLANSGTLTLTGAPVTNVEMGLMRAGDSNNDNVVSATDFNIVRATFGKSIGQPGYDARADFSGDNVVNSSDFSLLRGNFALQGAPPIGPGGR